MGKMRKSKEAQRMYNDKRWAEVKRIVWLRANGNCERCWAEGMAKRGKPYKRPGVDCHHIVPFETARTQAERERLCYNPDNVRLLCIPCHIKTHQEMGKNTKENIAQRRQQRRDRWIERIANMGNPSPASAGPSTGSGTAEQSDEETAGPV